MSVVDRLTLYLEAQCANMDIRNTYSDFAIAINVIEAESGFGYPIRRAILESVREMDRE